MYMYLYTRLTVSCVEVAATSHAISPASGNGGGADSAAADREEACWTECLHHGN